MDLVPPSGQMPLGREEDTLVRADGAPDCHRSRWNRTIWFTKPDSPICLVLSRSFRLLFVSCVNTFWRLCCGIYYFKHVKHKGWKLRQQRIRPRQGQHPQAHLRHLDGGGLQGVRRLPHQSQRALPLILRSDATGDCFVGYYIDCLQQAWGNTRGTTWPIVLSQWYSSYDQFCVREASQGYRRTAA
jgi:hypothetical protein